MKGNNAKNIKKILRMIRYINNLKEGTGLSNAFSAIYLYRESKIKTSWNVNVIINFAMFAA
jgi:hypothetical protein